MNLVINGESHSVEDAAKVSEILHSLGYDARAVAVAVNEEFVPRTAFPDTSLSDGDSVEIVAPMRGG